MDAASRGRKRSPHPDPLARKAGEGSKAGSAESSPTRLPLFTRSSRRPVNLRSSHLPPDPDLTGSDHAPPRVHADRTARRHRDHRHPDRPAAARRPEGPGGRQPDEVQQQPQADRPGPATTTTTPTGSFPPAGRRSRGGSARGHGDFPTSNFGPNWAVLLLPFIEQDNLYRQANAHGYPGVAITQGTRRPTARPDLAVDPPTSRSRSTSAPRTAEQRSTVQRRRCQAARRRVGLGARQLRRHGRRGRTSTTSPTGCHQDDRAHDRRGEEFVSSPMMSGQLRDQRSPRSPTGCRTPSWSPSCGPAIRRSTRGASGPSGFPGSSIVNAGRAATNPTPNNILGDSGERRRRNPERWPTPSGRRASGRGTAWAAPATTGSS